VAAFEIGQTITWGIKSYSDTLGGTLADVGTGPTATVTKPDGTTASATVTKSSTGTYVATIAATTLGRWRITWAASGANSGGVNGYTDLADVVDYSRLIVPLGDARAALEVPSTVVVNDEELRRYCSAATVVVENIIGSVLVASKVETLSGEWRSALPLTQHPTAITSVVENSVTLAATNYCYDGGGLLWKGSRPGMGAWSGAAPRNVVVTYTVGAAVIPDNVLTAAQLLVRHWWNQGAQGGYYVSGEPDVMTSSTIAGYAVPNFVVDMLAPSMPHKVPGFA